MIAANMLHLRVVSHKATLARIIAIRNLNQLTVSNK